MALVFSIEAVKEIDNDDIASASAGTQISPSQAHNTAPPSKNTVSANIKHNRYFH